MSKIIELHRKAKNNVGDFYCNPSRYFEIECLSTELVSDKYNVRNNTVIIGGGGLIHKKFSTFIENLLQDTPKKTVLWGIGHNFGQKHGKKSKDNPYYPEWINQCTLVGIRDWIKNYEKYYLPCVSCMHPAFDKDYSEQHEFVYFVHAAKSKFKNSNYPVMKNNEMNFDKVIEFLGSGNTIITDSYHGAYWGQLLGKNVQVASWSVKFDHMKHQPYFLDEINIDPTFIKNNIEGYLDECRELNNAFYQKFIQLNV
jgi:hypothetical protein